MIKKKLFQKNKNFKKLYICLILFILALILYYFFFRANEYFKITSFKGSFYVIPENKGGQIIPNQNKKGLHLSYKENNEIDFTIDPTLKYSIQLITHNNYLFIKNKRDELINKKDTIYLSKELFIAILKNSLGNEYFLLYKNFLSRPSALEYCEKHAFFIDKCLIVNVQNL